MSFDKILDLTGDMSSFFFKRKLNCSHVALLLASHSYRVLDVGVVLELFHRRPDRLRDNIQMPGDGGVIKKHKRSLEFQKRSLEFRTEWYSTTYTCACEVMRLSALLTDSKFMA